MALGQRHHQPIVNLGGLRWARKSAYFPGKSGGVNSLARTCWSIFGCRRALFGPHSSVGAHFLVHTGSMPRGAARLGIGRLDRPLGGFGFTLVPRLCPGNIFRVLLLQAAPTILRMSLHQGQRPLRKALPENLWVD